METRELLTPFNFDLLRKKLEALLIGKEIYIDRTRFVDNRFHPENGNIVSDCKQDVKGIVESVVGNWNRSAIIIKCGVMVEMFNGLGYGEERVCKHIVLKTKKTRVLFHDDKVVVDTRKRDDRCITKIKLIEGVG